MHKNNDVKHISACTLYNGEGYHYPTDDTYTTVPPINAHMKGAHCVDVVDVLLSFIVLSLYPVTVEVHADPIQDLTGELVLLPHCGVELEHRFPN